MSAAHEQVVSRYRAAGADRSALACGVRILAGSRPNARKAEAAARPPAPSLARPTSPAKPTDADGFIQRWLLLEPIRVPGQLTESAVRTAVEKDFPVPATPLPHDGDTLKVGDSELTWHAVDTVNYNVNLYHFAYALNKPTTNVLFWAVTVVNAPREMSGVRLAIGSNAASVWWVNGSGSDGALQRSPDGDRRRRLEAADVERRART